MAPRSRDPWQRGWIMMHYHHPPASLATLWLWIRDTPELSGPGLLERDPAPAFQLDLPDPYRSSLTCVHWFD